MTPDKDKGIFLSHAHGDRLLADRLNNMLVLAGVPSDRIFYSSDRSTGIPAGEDVRTFLQRNLQAAGLVIELISETFLRRPMCVMELGGAWALGTPTYPIVVPPLSRERVRTEIGDVQMGMLGTGRDLDELFDDLHDRLGRDVDIHTATSRWNKHVRDFKNEWPAKLVAVRGDVVTPAVDHPPAPLADSTGEQVVETAAEKTEAVSFGKSSVTGTGSKRELRGEATNNDKVSHTLYFSVVFLNAQEQIIGTKMSMVKLRPGGTASFNIPGIPEHDKYRIQPGNIYDF